MVGYPKTLNTKADYEFVRKNFPKDKWGKDFQNLLDTRLAWFNTGVIVDGQTGVTDDTHKVVEDEQTKQKYQYVYKENEGAKIFSIGYTVDEVEKIING